MRLPRPSPVVSRALGGLAFALAGFLIYRPAWRGLWLWDDAIEILANSAMRGSFAGLLREWISPSQVDYLPLKTTVQWLEWHAWGDAVLGYHLTSIALHVASALLLVRILGRMGVRWAWWGGALFLVHPLAVESVAWVSELKNTLSLPLMLLAWESHLTACEERRATGREGWTWADGRSALWFLAALLAKASVVMFPVGLLLHGWASRGRLRREEAVRSLPFFAIALVMGLVTLHFQQVRAIGGGEYDVGTWEARLGAAPLRLGFYLGAFVWPANLMPLYPRGDSPALNAEPALAWVTLAVVLGLLGYGRRRVGAPALACLLWFGVMAAPVLGVVPMSFLKYAWVSDHFAYVPSLGLVALAAMGMGAVSEAAAARVRFGAGMVSAGGLVLLLGLGAISVGVAGHYARAVDFWDWAARQNPGSWVAHHNLADAWASEAGGSSKAIGEYRKALALKPDSPEGHYSLGVLLARTPEGRAEAARQWEEALRLAPDFVEAHNNLANLLAGEGEAGAAEAQAHYRAVIRLRPDFAQGHGNLGLLLSRLPGRESEALEQFETALRLDGRDAQILQNLAALLARMPGRQAEAEARYRASLDLNGQSAEAHYDYGDLLASLPGRGADAVAEYRTALSLRRTYPEAHNNLAIVLARLPGRQAEAEAHLVTALAQRPDYVQAYNNLGLLLASETGREAEARRSYERALALAPDFAEAHSNVGVLLSRIPGEEGEAEVHFQTATRLRPSYPEAENNWANLLAREPGREREALLHYETALRLVPGAYSIHVNMALVLLRTAEGREAAVSHLRQALAINPTYAPARTLLQRLGLPVP